MQAKSAYVIEYPEMLQFEKQQMENFWLPSEPMVEKDVHQLKSGIITEAELHGIITASRLFTSYEVFVGDEYWSGRYKRMFPRPEFRRVGSVNAMTELNTHAPFYKKINEILSIDNEEFYNSYVNDPVLNARMKFIEKMVSSKDDMLSLASFSLVEGAILYSTFAYFKHYQANGKNKLGSFVAGIDFSVRDENIHSLAGAASFRLAIHEMLADKLITQEQYDKLTKKIYSVARTLRKHEHQINKMLFSKGNVEGINTKQLNVFVDSRINLCLENLGLKPLFKVNDKKNVIAKWFYKNISMPTIHDFFVNLGSQYNRNYSPEKFTVPTHYKFRG